MSDLRSYFLELADGEAEPPPVARLIGFEEIEVGEDRASVTLDAGEEHANPMGTVHGGILCDIADAAMAAAWASGLEEGETLTTLDLQIHFLRPVWDGRIDAEAEVVSRGRTRGLVQCDLVDDEGRRVARATANLMTLRGERARGR